MSLGQMISRFKEAVSCFVHGEMIRGFVSRFITRAVSGVFITFFASRSIVVATVVGASRGHTTGTGFLHGGILGGLIGAISAVRMLKSAIDGQPLSKVALLRRVVNGKAIMELMMAMETSYMEISDMYHIDGCPKGLSRSCIQRIPAFCNFSNHQIDMDCPICLQEWKNGEIGRKLKCGHSFHVKCIDEWLIMKGSCPVCRKLVCTYSTYYTS